MLLKGIHALLEPHRAQQEAQGQWVLGNDMLQPQAV